MRCRLRYRLRCTKVEYAIGCAVIQRWYSTGIIQEMAVTLEGTHLETIRCRVRCSLERVRYNSESMRCIAL